MNWNYVLIGVIAVVIILVIGLLVERWGVFEDDRAAEGTDRINRLDNSGPQERPRIPIRDKPRQLPLELKIISACIVTITAIVGYYAYRLLRTGNPVAFEYSTQLQYSVVALVGVGAGVAYRGYQDSAVGKVHIIYQSKNEDHGESEETILFDRNSVERQEDGSMLVKELRDERIFGLFRRRKLAGHDRRLRSDRPLGDIVTHEIHSDATKLEDGVWEMRTQGKDTVEGSKNAAADYRYKPPLRLPYEKQIKQKEQIRKMRLEKQSIRAQFAAANRQLDELTRKLENGEYAEREDLKSDMQDLKELVGATQEHVSVEASRPERRRQISDQGDIQKNGTEGSA